jgi:hypothetical protein
MYLDTDNIDISQKRAWLLLMIAATKKRVGDHERQDIGE